MKSIFYVMFVLLILTSCNTAQYTLGEQYLKGYKQVPKDGLNKEVYDTANIEPNLKFPARIGLARIDNGEMTQIPEEELAKWNELSKELGPKIGEFIPVSRLIASMVATTNSAKEMNRYDNTAKLQEIIRTLRLGAARQHLDVVYIYEVYGDAKAYITPAYIANITIIGAYLAPGRKIKAKGIASGLLLDVRNGYPYGTAETSLSDSEFSTSANSYKNQIKLLEAIKTKVGIKLVDETRQMFQKLKDEMVVAANSKD